MEASRPASKVARCASTSRQYSFTRICAPGGILRLLICYSNVMWG